MFKKDSTQKKRIDPGFPVDIMDIHGKIMFSSHVKIINISIGGVIVVLVETDRNLNQGNPCALKLEGRGMTLTLQGTVVRSAMIESQKDRDGGTPLYAIGLQFKNISSKKTKELVDFIGKYISSSQRKEGITEDDVHNLSGLRHNVRFHINTPEIAVLYFYNSFKVKQLGLGGMYIESEQVYENEKILPIEITLPENREIMVLGRVVKTLSAKDMDLLENEVGIEFINISEESTERLREFISSLSDTGTNHS